MTWLRHGVAALAVLLVLPPCAAAQKDLAPLPQEGRPVPVFAWPALHDSASIVSPLSLAGSVVVLDLWATWCEPCRREMPFLHEAWERFHGRGLMIVSVSFDSSPDRVDQYRATSYRMPWQHVHLSREAATDAMHLFRAAQFPRTLLLDRDGTVLRIDHGLRGAGLLATLDSALAGRLATPARIAH